jgi:peptidoglycan/xylan/chitin deacetylase (PgdA/CDA1 family)
MDENSSEWRLARRAALARTQQRRRLSAFGALLAIVIVLLLALGRSETGGAPPAPHAGAASAPKGEAKARLAAADRAVDGVIAYTSYISRGSPRRKEVALTFDDGPGPTTPALLHYLVADGVPATFFLVGRAIEQHVEVVRKESDAGFTLGTHTENHARLASKTVADQSQEILGAADRITRVTGHAVRFFRPPYGSFDAHTLDILRAERMLMVLWSVDTRDFSSRSPAPIVLATLSGARGGSVILLHDGPGPRPITLKAVRRIVTRLRAEGFRLVSLPKMLLDDPPPRSQPVPRSLAG